MKVTAKLSVYNCRVDRTIDGDSFYCVADVRSLMPDVKLDGFHPHVRVIGVDTPERGEDGWMEARVILDEWLRQGPFNLVCYGREKYGRLLADAERGHGLLSDHLIEQGAPVLRLGLHKGTIELPGEERP